MNVIKHTSLVSLLLMTPSLASAFCGFYVAKADTKLFNKASHVAIARDDNKTVMTMANDFQGSLKEFAIVIPVPTVITKAQIHIGDKAVLDHLDAYSAPRLVEYFDENPCELRSMGRATHARGRSFSSRSLGFLESQTVPAIQGRIAPRNGRFRADPRVPLYGE